MLASAIYPPVTEFRTHPHWSPSGERGLAISPNTEEDLLTFLNEASTPDDLQAMEDRLVYFGITTVCDRVQSGSCIDHDWVTAPFQQNR